MTLSAKAVASQPSQTDPSSPVIGPTFFLASIHLVTLFNFAVSQPIYDRLTERLAFCRDLNMPAWAVYSFTIALSLGLPLLLIAIPSIGRCWGARISRRILMVFQFILWCLLALPLLKSPGFLDSIAIYAGAVGLAVAATYCYWKSAIFRSILTVCAIGVPLFPALFLMRYSASTDSTYATTQRLEESIPAPVVMIVFDEFCGLSLMTPDRQIDAVRFPNFAELARDGHWFRNAASVYELTAVSVPSILSGRYPESQWFTNLGDRPQNLFTMLVGAGGYDYAAFEPVTRLSPEGLGVDHTVDDLWSVRIPEFVSTLGRVYLHHLVPEPHAQCLPQVSKLWFGVRTASNIDPSATRGTFRYGWSINRDQQWAHFLRTIDGINSPKLHFIHALLPHVPWSYFPSGRRYTNDSKDWELEQLGNEGDAWSNDELHSTHGQQRYVLQLMYADHLLGQAIAKLRETGMYDQSMIVVTADHGISFRAGEFRRGTGLGNRDEIQAVPLFIKRPGEIAGQIHDRPVELVDIFPTIAETLGYRLTLRVDGWSVFDEQRPVRKQRRYGIMYENLSAPVDEIANSRVPLELSRRFGNGDDPDRLFRVGPIPELLERRVDSLPQTNAPPVKMELWRYSDVWPTDVALPVPGFYEGHVLGHNPVDEPPVVIAVAVNGVIQAVTRTYRHAAGLSQWSALVPEKAFHPGQNDVRCYQVQGEKSKWTLTPCQFTVVPKQDT